MTTEEWRPVVGYPGYYEKVTDFKPVPLDRLIVTDQFRAMCAELLAWAEHTSSHYYKQPDVLDRARALLAQPVAEGPTDEELEDLAEVMNVSGNPVPAMRRALELWGRPTPQPEGSDIHYSWELHDAEGEWQAGGSAITLESVRREGNHSLQTYSQDGPHTLIIYQASTIEVVTND